MAKPRGRPFQKGHPRLGGRKKGTPNKITTDVRQAIINAVNSAGGERWLLSLAQKDRRAMAQLFGRCITQRVEEGPSTEERAEQIRNQLREIEDVTGGKK